eukprot:3107061-Amphidinium_carterae.3
MSWVEYTHGAHFAHKCAPMLSTRHDAGSPYAGLRFHPRGNVRQHRPGFMSPMYLRSNQKPNVQAAFGAH